MGSSYTQDLAFALRANPNDKVALKSSVLRLTKSIRERATGADPSSLEFVRAGVSLIRRLNTPICAADCYASMADAVPYLWAHADFGTALTAADLMYRFAAELDRKDLLRQAENFRGIVHRILGNIADATIHYQRALSIAQDIGDVKIEAVVLSNIGSLLCEVGLYQEAQDCMARVLRLRGADLAEERSSTYHNLATVLSRLGRRDEAVRAARQGLVEMPEPVTVQECFSCAMREAAYIYMALEHDDPEELRKHLDRCRMYAIRSATRPAECYFELATGLLMMRESDDANALSVLGKVLQSARHLAHTGLVEDSLAALAWAHENRGEFAEALNYVRQFIEYVAARRRLCLDAIFPTRMTDEEATHDLLPLRYRAAKLETAAIRLEARLKRAEMLERIAMTASLRDDPSGMHGYRVGKMSAMLARELGWSSGDCHDLETAARLHDIGKSAIPDHILFSAGPLRNVERDFIRSHPEIGSSLLASASDGESRLAADIALYHHEHWDGSGYPKGLSRVRIPIAARIVAIADVFDALTHGRPYAGPWTMDRALSEIRKLSGSQFDPDLVEPFIRLINELQLRHADLDRFLEASAQASPFLAARKKIEAMVLRDRQALETAN